VRNFRKTRLAAPFAVRAYPPPPCGPKTDESAGGGATLLHMTRNRKPYDQAFKYLSETDPRALLAMLGALDADAPATVTRLPKELIVSAVIADEIFLVEADGDRWIVHIEAQTRYDPTLPVRLAQYAIRLHLAYDLPVRTFLLLLTKRGVPEPVPTEGVIEVERLRLTFGYDVVKLWELPAAAFLETARPALLPFVPLMRATGRN
jgi:predicted transposase YdaD